MKYKNYKSAIHNFTHSFISIDYIKSGKLAVNVLIDLHNLGKETEATFNFIKGEINPNYVDPIKGRQLLNDYLKWLPKHLNNHNCDLNHLEKLEIKITTDFQNTIPCDKNKKAHTFQISALTRWKVIGREEQILEVSQTELIPRKFIGLKEIPRITELR